jgi:hypothetical protein
LAGEHAAQPLDRVREAAATLEVPRLGGQLWEQVSEPFAGNPRKRRSLGMPMIAWATQSVTTSASMTIRRAFRGGSGRRSSAVQNGGAESVEVGVHRGLLVDGALSTADFDLSPTNPWHTATTAVELI